jgi:hypothetical protein
MTNDIHNGEGPFMARAAYVRSGRGRPPESSGAVIRGWIDDGLRGVYAVPGRPHLQPTMTNDIHTGEGPFMARAAQVARMKGEPNLFAPCHDS